MKCTYESLPKKCHLIKECPLYGENKICDGLYIFKEKSVFGKIKNSNDAYNLICAAQNEILKSEYSKR